MDESSSSMLATGHKGLVRGLVNADRLTSACAKHRARGCVMNQPSFPGAARRQLMRFPRGSSSHRGAPALNVTKRGGEGASTPTGRSAHQCPAAGRVPALPLRRLSAI
ncbi:unnamed protein product [Pleuronectes platessa]|uniref:Uncharacterized protein n=1 Tax=Pleuronectes platessa TaxID=8262 RepID=A0A9N7VBK7_PLEPL|nr:unnamed protein product [Pleuronectes platessa]